jgi:hypothetical protein
MKAVSARNAGEPSPLQRRDRPGQAWRGRAWRVAGAGLAGAGLGAAVAGIWHAALALGNASCARDSRAAGDWPCIPLGLWLLGIVVNCTVIALGVIGVFTVLRLRPRRALVPFGCVVVALTAIVSASSIAGPPGPPPWEAALEAGVGLAAVAMTAIGGRARVAGPMAVVVLLAAGWIVPRVIAHQERADARLAGFTALKFPLEAPNVPGYHLYAADAVEGVLDVSVRQAIRYPGTTEVTVVVGPADGAWAKQQLALCTKPVQGSTVLLYSCRPIRPGLLLMANATSGNAVMATRAGLVATASADSMPTPVTTATLIAIATSLRPVDAATLAALAG